MPGSTTPSSGGVSPNLGPPQDVLELADARLGHALLLLGRVVATVLLEITLGARLPDALGQLGTGGPLRWSSSRLQLVVGVLGQPDDALRRSGWVTAIAPGVRAAALRQS
jgi:hypothetical protein